MDNIRLAQASRFAMDATADFKTREEGEELFIEGYFSVFNSPYEMWEDYTEIVRNGAFRETLRKDDIRALINHDTTLVLGRNTAGTLELSEDEHGLFGRIRVNRNDQDAMNAYARVQRGDVTQCSFGFDVEAFDTEVEEGHETCYLTRVKLYEVSVCTFPAYTDTQVQARNAAACEARRTEARKRAVEAWRTEQLQKLRKE